MRVCLSHLIYSRDCIDAAAGAYCGICSVARLEDTPDTSTIDLRVDATGCDERAIQGEFLNALLHLSIESRFRSI